MFLTNGRFELCVIGQQKKKATAAKQTRQDDNVATPRTVTDLFITDVITNTMLVMSLVFLQRKQWHQHRDVRLSADATAGTKESSVIRHNASARKRVIVRFMFLSFLFQKITPDL